MLFVVLFILTSNSSLKYSILFKDTLFILRIQQTQNVRTVMDERLQANIHIDRAEVILTNLIALTDADKDHLKVPVLDIVVSLSTAIELLQTAQDDISHIEIPHYQASLSNYLYNLMKQSFSLFRSVTKNKGRL